MGGRHAVLPVERQPEVADPLSQSGHLALLYRSPPQVHYADAAQGQEPGQRRLIIAEDFLIVCSGDVQIGVPVIALWKETEKREVKPFYYSRASHMSVL